MANRGSFGRGVYMPASLMGEFLAKNIGNKNIIPMPVEQVIGVIRWNTVAI